MKKGRGPPAEPSSRGPRKLSDADKELWSHTAKSLEPLRRAKPRVLRGGAPAAFEAIAAAPEAPLQRRPDPPEQKRPRTVPRPAPSAAASPQPAFAQLDRRKARKIAAGHIEIDARLDLHGLRQAEAHLRLRTFLLQAQAAGLRTVLVITGKGTGGDTTDAGPTFGERDERGVIRRNVPRWLAQAELRAVVVSFAAAHARHGGGGALYLHLRKLRSR